VDREWSRTALVRVTDVLRTSIDSIRSARHASRRGAQPRISGRAAVPARCAGHARGWPGVEGETLRLASHKVVLKQEEEQASASMEAVFEKAGLAVPPVTEVLAKSGVDPARARTLLQILLRQGRLVKIGDDLVFHRSALASLRQLLPPTRDSGSRCRNSKTSPVSRASMRSRCSNTWIASASPAATATSG